MSVTPVPAPVEQRRKQFVLPSEMQPLLFVSAVPLRGHVSSRVESRAHTSLRSPTRLQPACNINLTNDAGREDEIAAKIAALRKHKRLKSQRDTPSSDIEDTETTKISSDSGAQPHVDGSNQSTKIPSEEISKTSPSFTADNENGLFSQLPDWKKEEILQRQIADAERFFNPGPSESSSTSFPSSPPTSPPPSPPLSTPPPSPSPPQSLPVMDNDKTSGRINNENNKTTNETYKPKVSTWGMFPRPDNISRAYGGGRRIERGGNALNSTEWKERDAKVSERLAAYRASRGINTEREAAHREQIEAALSRADALMRETRTQRAINELEKVTSLVSIRSRLGGRVYLTLAVAYDAIGRRDDAKSLYAELRRNPFDNIGNKAKQLLQGFDAMEKLRFEDSTEKGRDRGAEIRLPDLNVATERRYETAVIGQRRSPIGRRDDARIGAGLSIALAALTLSPLFIVGLLALTHRMR